MPSSKVKPHAGLDALAAAHRLSVAPFVFQTACALKDFGILAVLDEHFSEGLTKEQIAETLSLEDYVLDVLLPAGLAFSMISLEDNRWRLSDTGFFLLNDPLVKVNFDFTRDVCYKGLTHLGTALREHRPAGLSVFGEWETLYPHLRDLPEPARSSWFAFDHFYSDSAFRAALPVVFSSTVTSLVDIGGNTGKWALACCRYNTEVKVTIYDLPEQCEIAAENARAAGLSDRIHTHPVNLLDGQALTANNAQAWWMSQFLDCFSPAEVVSILKRVHAAMSEEALLYILEPLTDRQPYEAGRLSLAAYSLYFTVMANGTSRFYAYADLEMFLAQSGFDIIEVKDNIGAHSTLLVCRRRS